MRLKNMAAQYRSGPPHLLSTGGEAAAHFSRVFSLWADPQYDESRRAKHLADVMDSAVKFAVWLLSHPEQFELRWQGTGADTGSNLSKEMGEHLLVTVPALVKVTSQRGKRLPRRDEKVLTEAVYKRV